MGSLSSIYLKKEALEVMLKSINKKDATGIDVTVSINDESKSFSGKNGDIYQNVSAYVSQTKEDREAEKPKYYIGNGKCFWTDGTIKVAGDNSQSSKPKAKKQVVEDDDDLPF